MSSCDNENGHDVDKNHDGHNSSHMRYTMLKGFKVVGSDKYIEHSRDDALQRMEVLRVVEETLPTSVKEKETHWLRRAASPPQSYKEEKAHEDLEGYWKHPPPEPGCEEHYYFP
eukprot:15141-Pelagomonas_calceolata.AAC.1